MKSSRNSNFPHRLTCSHCERGATFDVPELLCDLHWQIWFMEGFTGTPKELYKICAESLHHMWEEHGEPEDSDEILLEAAKLFGGKKE